MARINILNPGAQTTIQDLGRPEHQIDGFPESGSMDQQAMKIANLLVNNDFNAPVLEFVITGPTVIFSQPTFIAITGGDFSVKLNGKLVKNYECIQVQAKDRLEIGSAAAGMFGYLAVKGGWQVEKLLDSCSTILRLQLGGFHGRQLKAGDHLSYHSSMTMPCYFHRHANPRSLPDPAKKETIRFLKGPQWSEFSKRDQRLFMDQDYQVTKQVDRMGYRLTGDPLTSDLPSMLSDATVRGAIQMTTSGLPIVLMADRQTTGGYPLIGVVASCDLDKLVQCRPGQTIHFEEISLPAATAALRDRVDRLAKLADQIQRSRYLPPFGINRVAAQKIKELF